MRKPSAVLSLIFLSLVLLSFEDAPYASFESKRYGYRIDIPNGFFMQGDWGKQTSWIYQPKEDEKFDDAVVPIISVISYDIAKHFSANTLFNTKVKNVQEKIAEKDSIYDDLEILNFDGGYALMYKEVNRDDPQSLNHWYVNVYGNGKEYLIEISGTRDQLRRWNSEFTHVVESFGLIP